MRTYTCLFLLLFLLFHCTGFSVLSELVNQQITVIMKGTYESNSPYAWETGNVFNNDYVSSLPSPLSNSISYSDLKLYLDIADLQVSKHNYGKFSDFNGNIDFLEFVNDRELLCPIYTTYQNKTFTLCQANNGIQRHIDFFNEGLTLKANDLRSGDYKSVAFFLRRIVTHPSFLYDGDNNLVNSSNSEGEITSFDNRTIRGSLISSYYQYAVNDNSGDTDDRFFPLFHSGFNFNVPETTEEYVLEFRIFIKNLLMKHVIEDDSNATAKRRTVFVGISDWNINHDYSNDDKVNSADFYRKHSKLGGNIIMGVRIYKPSTIGSVRFTAVPANSCGTGKAYIALLKAGESLTTSTLPYAATQLTANTILTNIPEGSYSLFITQDKMLRNSTGLVSGQDGYPESNQMCMNTINVTKANQLDLDISSCACP